MNADSDNSGNKLQTNDFAVETLGNATMPTPLKQVAFADENRRVPFETDQRALLQYWQQGEEAPSFEIAGPRRNIYHDPAWSRAAVVTCGGLCPGLNDVIKAVVNTLYYYYGVEYVYGIRYGLKGLVSEHGLSPIELTPEVVDTIHEKGGSVLGTSRGEQDTGQIVHTLERMKINMLFCIGGDGTMRAARDIYTEIKRRRLPISVVGVPKTIDNDISFIDRTFGFETAVYNASPVISCAHDEAKAVYNGVGLVKLMGRDSGFIAAYATLANSVVNFCLVPEVDFELEGEQGLLTALERRLTRKDHAVIVVAEGAGQNLFQARNVETDASGNVVHADIGRYLENQIENHLSSRGFDHSVKYFDPSYTIRSVPANGTDAIFCVHLAENAVHAAIAGRTNMLLGHWHGHFTHVPIQLVTRGRRKLDPKGQVWQSVLGVTRQRNYWF